MASVNNMSALDFQEPLSDVSDSSFVILGHGSVEHQKSSDFNKSDSSTTKSRISALESISSNSSSKKFSKSLDGNSLIEDEIQNKLDELIKENYQLKETLNQNNVAIKSQLDTFFMWQQEVLKTHESHKQKFIETKDLILKLRTDNCNLKKQLNELSCRDYFVKSNDHCAEVDRKPEELIKLREKVQKYENTCDELIKKNENLSVANNILKEELKLSKNEILKSNKEVEDLKRENLLLKQQNLERGCNSFGSLSQMSFSDAHTEIKSLLQQLEEEKAKVSIPKEELMKSNGNSEMLDLNINIEKINECIPKIDNLNSSLDNQYQRFNSLQSWISFTKENLKDKVAEKGVESNLNNKIQQLKSYLSLEEEKDIFKQKQDSLLEMQTKFISLLENYKTLQSDFELVKNNQSSIKDYEENLNAALAQIDAKDKELKEKQDECNKLKEANEKLNLECENFALLKVQFEIYQSDFNEERAKLVGEKAELEERIQLLESQNSTFKGKNYNLCPKCNFSISNFETYEDHVENCTNSFFYP